MKRDGVMRDGLTNGYRWSISAVIRLELVQSSGDEGEDVRGAGFDV